MFRSHNRKRHIAKLLLLTFTSQALVLPLQITSGDSLPPTPYINATAKVGARNLALQGETVPQAWSGAPRNSCSTTKQSETDLAGNSTAYGYDSMARLNQVTQTNGSNDQVTVYGYDKLGNKISQQDAQGHVTLWVLLALRQYWVFYVTKYYYGELDQELSRFDFPSDSVKDRRKLLQAPAFKHSRILDDLYIFRLPSTSDYVVSDCCCTTEKFYELANMHNLGGQFPKYLL